MDDRLKHAAEEGAIETLYEVIRVDKQVLKRIDETPFEDTPVHIAAAAGQTHFAIELMILNPSLGKKLNPDGLSPLHLALLHGHAETAMRLVRHESGLVRVKGKEGCTPLHCAAESEDRVEQLGEFLMACPASVEDVTVRGKTAVHVAVEKQNYRGFKVLLGWLQRTGNTQVLNWKDEEGNTVLHVAASTNPPKLRRVVKLLINQVDRNARNLNGKTAREIALQNQAIDGNVKRMLSSILGRTSRASRVEPYTKISEFLYSEDCFYDKTVRFIARIRDDLSIDMRNVLLIVAALIVTTAYQAILQPPGGLQQENASPADTQAVLHPFAVVRPEKGDRTRGHVAGKTVMAGNSFSKFMPANTIAFMASIGVIMFVLPVRSYTLLLHLSLFCLMFSYIVAVDVISDSKMLTFFVLFAGWMVIFLSFNIRLLGTALYFIVEDIVHNLVERYLPRVVWLARRTRMQLAVIRLHKNDLINREEVGDTIIKTRKLCIHIKGVEK